MLIDAPSYDSSKDNKSSGPKSKTLSHNELEKELLAYAASIQR